MYKQESYNLESFKSFYQIVDFLNENNIKKENIIKIIERNNDTYAFPYCLIYWG